MRAGRERGLRAALRGASATTRSATVPIGYGDGVRRALTNNAEVLVGGRRFPLVGTVSMDNVTLDLGPDGGGVRWATRRVLIGAGRAVRPRSGPPAGHDQLRGHLRADARASRATTTATGSAAGSTLAARGARAESARGSWAAPARPPARAPDRRPRRGRRRRRPRRRPRARPWRAAAHRSSCPTSSAPGASSAAIAHGRSTSRRCRAARWRRTSARARLHRQRDGRAAGRRRVVDPHGGARDLRERRLRMVSREAFAADPLRVLRAGAAGDPSSGSRPSRRRPPPPRARAAAWSASPPERVFGELRRIVAADRGRAASR